MSDTATVRYHPWEKDGPMVSLEDYKKLQAECDALRKLVQELETRLARLSEYKS